MQTREFDAGPDQTITLYMSDDTGEEIDYVTLYEAIAADAARRAEAGMRIVSVVGLPVRHAGVTFGRSGSGYQTKALVTVVYEGPYGDARNSAGQGGDA